MPRRDTRDEPTTTPVSAPAPDGVDDLSAEFAAMRAVGDALAHLADVESRRRVLRWAAERFQPGQASEPVVAPCADFPAFNDVATPSSRKLDDPGLTLDGFDPFAELLPHETPRLRPA